MAGRNLLVVSSRKHWNLTVEGVTVCTARDYLAQRPDSDARVRVFNLCHSYAYQSLGYYVSLLADARGHRAIPSAQTLRDFRAVAIVRSFAEEINELIQSSLKSIPSEEHTVRMVFGEAESPAMQKLGKQLYRLFPAPFLQAQFSRRKNRWVLDGVSALALSALTDTERQHMERIAEVYLVQQQAPRPVRQRYDYDLAVVVNPKEADPPSDPRALQRFTEAANRAGFYVDTISTSDTDRLAEFDAVWLRETTAVDHPTYRLSRLAEAEGLVVIDDPRSIRRSANKIFLSESLARAKIPAPKSRVLTEDDLRGDRLDSLDLPSVLKLPDAAFSRGVKKAESREELRELLKTMLKESDLVLAQAFVPSEYDWRIGVLDEQPLYACKYHMAPNHWQIYNWAATKPKDRVGKYETVAIPAVPGFVVQTALKAARLIGNGLYGVDVKQFGDKAVIIEVNDNPSIEAGVEDAVLGSELYRRLAVSFRARIEASRRRT